jgi:hypothetical protein
LLFFNPWSFFSPFFFFFRLGGTAEDGVGEADRGHRYFSNMFIVTLVFSSFLRQFRGGCCSQAYVHTVGGPLEADRSLVQHPLCPTPLRWSFSLLVFTACCTEVLQSCFYATAETMSPFGDRQTEPSKTSKIKRKKINLH